LSNQNEIIALLILLSNDVSRSRMHRQSVTRQKAKPCRYSSSGFQITIGIFRRQDDLDRFSLRAEPVAVKRAWIDCQVSLWCGFAIFKMEEGLVTPHQEAKILIGNTYIARIQANLNQMRTILSVV